MPDELELRPLEGDEYLLLPPLIQMLEPQLPLALISSRIELLQSRGWRCVGAWSGGELVGVAGFSEFSHLFSGPVLYVENVVVVPEARGAGVGPKLMDWLEIYARNCGCNKLTLDAYAANTAARRFYERLAYDPRGVHFVKDLED